MTACTHGMPTPASCIDCHHDGNLPPTIPPNQVEQVERTFTARFRSECPGCSMPIIPGQAAARTTADRTFHVGCAP